MHKRILPEQAERIVWRRDRGIQTDNKKVKRPMDEFKVRALKRRAP